MTEIADWVAEILPVHVKNLDEMAKAFTASQVQEVRPQHFQASTFTIGSAASAKLDILQEDPLRDEALVWVSSLAVGAPFTVGNPAAGTADVLAYTATSPVTLTSLIFQYVTDATVANRIVRIQYRDAAGNTIVQVSGLTADPASTTSQVSAFIGSSNNGGASGNVITSLPNIVLQPGWTVHLIVINGGAGDQFSGIEGTTSGSPSVQLCHSDAEANDALKGNVTGAVLAAAGFPLPIRGTGKLWAVSASGQACQVSVLATRRG